MELLPLGPVLFIDTAGHRRRGRARRAARREAHPAGLRPHRPGRHRDRGRRVGRVRGRHPRTSCASAGRRSSSSSTRPTSRAGPAPVRRATGQAHKIRRSLTARRERRGVLDLRQALLDARAGDFIDNPAILGDLVGPGELAVLVVPIDKEAPNGRLILPQVQSIRDLLDGDAMALVVKERELRDALERLNAAAGAGGDRLAGLPQGRGRHAARRPDDLLLHPLRPVQGRPRRAGGGRAGHRRAARPATAC